MVQLRQTMKLTCCSIGDNRSLQTRSRMLTFYRPHPKDEGRYCFQFVCQFTPGGEYPVPGLGRGGTPCQVWIRGGTPSQVWMGGCPIPGLYRRGTPSQVWTGGTPSQVWTGGHPIPGLDGGHPISGLDYWEPHPRSGQGGYHIPGLDRGGTPSQVWMGGTPSQVWTGGVPHPRSGHGGHPIPGLDRGYPIPDLDRGYPIPGLDRGYPIPGLDRGVPPSQVWMGVFPIPGLDVGGLPRVPPWPGLDWIPPPPPGLDGVPLLTMTGWGTPPHGWMGYPPSPLEQHSEHLLCGRRYASCVHAGGLSCSHLFLCWCKVLRNLPVFVRPRWGVQKELLISHVLGRAG